MTSKKNLYTALGDLLLSLHKLFESMNLQVPKSKLNLPQKHWLVLENIVLSPVTIQNLEQIRLSVNEAAKQQEDRSLDRWNAEKTVLRLKKQIAEMSSDSEKLQADNSSLKEQLTALSQEIEDAEKSFKEKIFNLNEKFEKEKESQFISFVKEIILIRDNLTMKEEMLKSEENYRESKAYTLIQLSYRETENILNRMGISVINQTGPFNNLIQMVSDTTPTDNEDLHDTVARSFREGYRTNDKLIRLQEVILYSFKN
jgi:molecular chaperone GrpE (heat shock protein)